MNAHSITKLFDLLLSMYGELWESRHGSSAIDSEGNLSTSAQTWLRLFRYAGITPSQMNLGIGKIIKNPSRYAPTASEMIALCVINTVEAQIMRQSYERPKNKPKALPNHKRATNEGLEALANIKKMIGGARCE